VHEIGQQLGPVGGVDDLGMELHAEHAPAVVGDGGKGRAVGHGHGAEAVGCADDLVAVAHPDLVLLALGPDALEQGAVLGHLDEGAAEFAVVGGFDLAAGLGDHGLFAVTNTEHGQAAHGRGRVEQGLGRPGCRLLMDGGRPARQNHALGAEGLDEGFVDGVEGVNFAVNAGFPHPARNQLRHLGAEIDDQDFFRVKIAV